MSDARFETAGTGSDILLDGMFTTQAVSAALDDQARLRTMMAFEVALAEAEAALDIIPVQAARHIAFCARPEGINVPALAAAAARAGNIAIPFVAAFTAMVARENSEAARYVHWGATSQDVIDTATILQLQEAVMAIRADLQRLEQTLAGITKDHIGTVLPGRTWLQHAVPTTFGLKAAGWLTAVTRARWHLEAAVAQASCVQFGGAAGTLASLDGRGIEVAAELARRLKLGVPPLPWHTLRSDLAACGSALGILCGALGKLARDLSLMMQTEIAETLPPGGKGQGGSSTMPHKRNPVGCAIALSVATQAPGLVATLLSAMVQEHERGLGGWHAEWQTLPALLRLTSASAAQMADTVEAMEICPDAMRNDLGKTRGLMMAEAVSMELANRLGREAAHHLLQQLTRTAVKRNVTLDTVLREDDRVTAILSPDDISRLMNPAGYLGNARAFCIRALEAWRNGGNEECS
ncbi:3-carboxy-cis,cis-muconate cycloisomerase [Acetobacter musti]|uniref:3-carboxy-cis,cis-muconate cycloisomerase n=1 Tax=Acetobacter musti TaxID=864732 RepID=A0ABX0JS98_9PROT|nr:3-carboxy-cis,cis-muconate cycloisomerase [Acetobacter musti]NHN86348.1 3-carboxy-cis,cis-muconate cycloisomerase [Acetobacter musti]